MQKKDEQNINYDKSRLKTKNALSRFKNLISKYPDVEEIFRLSEEEKAWIEREIKNFGNIIASIRYKGFSFLDKVKWFRNKIAHATEDSTDEELKEIYSYFLTNADKIIEGLEKNIKKCDAKNKDERKFEKSITPSIGSKEEKKILIDALERSFDAENEEAHIEFPKTNYGNLMENVVSSIFSSPNFSKDYIMEHKGLLQNIKTDIFKWLKNLDDIISLKNPFIGEMAFIENLKYLPPTKIANQIDEVRENYTQVTSEISKEDKDIQQPEIAFDFYDKNVRSTLNLPQEVDGEDNSLHKLFSAEEVATKLEIVTRNLIKDMDIQLLQRKTKWELEKIESERVAFLTSLFEKINTFRKIEKLLTPFISNVGKLWDLSITQFRDYGFEVLQAFADMLQKDEALQELANILGRHTREEAKFEKEMREKIIISNEWKAHPSPRGMIEGITYSNDISNVLPSELALWKHPLTKPLFQLKFIKKELFCFKYTLKTKEKVVATELYEASVAKKEEKGPIIICVDTSGSMSGTPENIAKTIVFALAKIAIEEKRLCYLISFSSSIETMELTNWKDFNAIERLVDFLRMSFNGGTDASPALEHSVGLLQKENWKYADVLMMSDFVMDSLEVKIEEAIEAEKKKGTRFFSLVVGRSGNNSVIECFNENWAYNIEDKNRKHNLIRQLHSIKTRD